MSVQPPRNPTTRLLHAAIQWQLVTGTHAKSATYAQKQKAVERLDTAVRKFLEVRRGN